MNSSNAQYMMSKTHYHKSYKNIQKISKTPRDVNNRASFAGVNQELEPLIENSGGSLFESVKTAS